MSDNKNELTELETNKLADLEEVIESGLQSAYEALLVIRDERLYRKAHGSFEDYLQERWSVSRAHGYRLIDAAHIARQVSPIGRHGEDVPPPATERVARELTPLKQEPEKMKKAWTEAVEEHGPTPTAKQVHEIVAKHIEPAREPDPGELERDDEGHLVDPDLRKVEEIDAPQTAHKRRQARAWVLIHGELLGVRLKMRDALRLCRELELDDDETDEVVDDLTLITEIAATILNFVQGGESVDWDAELRKLAGDSGES